jgi:hypothetical protein
LLVIPGLRPDRFDPGSAARVSNAMIAMPVGRTRLLASSAKQRLNEIGKIFPSSCGGQSVERPMAKLRAQLRWCCVFPPVVDATGRCSLAQSIV